MTRVALAFGGNDSASEAYFQKAIRQLQQAGINHLEFASPIRSSPMGADAGSEFVNSAGVFETKLSAEELLPTIHNVEEQMGRKRSVRWGPRPIDIDVIFYGDKVIDTNKLVIPHPCAWYRSFVLKPLANIAPNWDHPVLGESVEDLLNRLERRPLTMAVHNNHPVIKPETLDVVLNEQNSQLRFQTDKTSENYTPHADDLFGQISVEVAEATDRSQPAIEGDRTIRCCLPRSECIQEFRQFLKDVEAAVLG